MTPPPGKPGAQDFSNDIVRRQYEALQRQDQELKERRSSPGFAASISPAHTLIAMLISAVAGLIGFGFFAGRVTDTLAAYGRQINWQSSAIQEIAKHDKVDLPSLPPVVVIGQTGP